MALFGPSVGPLATIVILAGFVLLPATSGYVVRYVLQFESNRDLEAELGQEAIDTGAIIGKCENLLVFALILAGAYTALAVIFAAKSIIRREDMTSGDTLYYLAGTMVNFTYSVVFALLVVSIVAVLP